jgi:hypothetical protein
MAYDGKRKARLQFPEQVCMPEELAEDVRFFARFNNRSIGLQMVHYLSEGVKEDKRKFTQTNSGAEPKGIRKVQGSSVEDVA